ncbi:Alternative dihydrofolate reductase 3 [plant metagenome]|uniref:Alternative dihydrofolate reductase 3 n=2 Tax=root TaxID=1 RepID=A0A1C3K3R8_9BURK|nr:nuclear transport factor 2 family protein [Orrella dioscoreae]SBT26094.1 Alternative dihydrofolate reductase 3 [Orrella dioscoreae]SOE47848.1 Alternative dihydrofolate reductase 3 [Orrella dioscoreae]
MFATPDEAEHAFYEALEQGDTTRLMQIWADDEEIVCVHPGGVRLVGHAAVLESWQEILGNGPLVIRPLRNIVMHSMMCAVHNLVEQVSASTPEGNQIVHCYATHVYHKGPTGWRLVLHHASPAPPSAGLLDMHDMPDTLH